MKNTCKKMIFSIVQEFQPQVHNSYFAEHILVAFSKCEEIRVFTGKSATSIY